MTFKIGEDCQIHETAVINVDEGEIGPRSIVRAGAIIEGHAVYLGTESYLDIRARIGGGSCMDNLGILVAGDFFHMGVDSHVNIARRVSIGNEVGLGVETKIFTHGAYLSALDGFPVKFEDVIIGDRVWLPNAWVNPGVVIEDDVVVGARSLVNKYIPHGCLAYGSPIHTIKPNMYPTQVTPSTVRKLFDRVAQQIRRGCYEQISWTEISDYTYTIDGGTTFDFKEKKIYGLATDLSELLKNQLRRNGVRFKYYAKNGEYASWKRTQRC